MRLKKTTGLDAFATRMKVSATWESLALPPGENAALRQIVEETKERQARGKPGFFGAARGGTGVIALLVGPSGTVKTRAAEVLANDLRRDLYRVELSAVRSTYIGETEKNLARLIQEAERSQAVLFFDEADSLFGRRSGVKDAHDRYATLDLASLLQRLESFNGLAILATNQASQIDQSFLRRIRHIVKVP